MRAAGQGSRARSVTGLDRSTNEEFTVCRRRETGQPNMSNPLEMDPKYLQCELFHIGRSGIGTFIVGPKAVDRELGKQRL